MKKLIMIWLLTMPLFSGSVLVNIPCEELIQYNQACVVNPNEYSLKQVIIQNSEPYIGSITIDYEDLVDVNVITDVNGTFTTDINTDQPFRLKIGSFTSDRLKLTILSTGNESWKYFYIGTSRWRNYDITVIMDAGSTDANVTEPPVDANVTEPPVDVNTTNTNVVYDMDSFPSSTAYPEEVTYPQIVHVGTQSTPNLFQHTIRWEDGTPLVNSLVKVDGVDGWRYIVKTTSEGLFTFHITDRGFFHLSALDEKTGDWSMYNNLLNIDEDKITWHQVNGTWEKMFNTIAEPIVILN